MQWTCQSFRCSRTIAHRRCSNYIFVDLAPGFHGLGKDNCKTRRESSFGNWCVYIRGFSVHCFCLQWQLSIGAYQAVCIYRWWLMVRLHLQLLSLSYLPWHDDVNTCKPYPHYWLLVRGIHRSTIDSHHKEPVMWKKCLFVVILNKLWNKKWCCRWFIIPFDVTLLNYISNGKPK